MSNPGTTNLVAWWNLNETSGTRADSHGSNTLTDNNTVLFNSAGKYGNAADFELTNSEYLSLNDNADMSTGDIDFTVGCWVKLESKPGINQQIMTKSTSNVVREYQLFHAQANDRFSFTIFDSGGNSVGNQEADNLGAPSLGAWYFVVAWHDSSGNTVNIQVNNGTVDSSATSGAPSDTAANFIMGARHNGTSGYTDGLVDEAFLYKRILTAAERTWLYNSGAGRIYGDLTAAAPATTNLVAWWELNETSGNRSDSHGSNTLTDNNTVGFSAGGVQGNAADFEVTNNERLSIADNADLSMGDIDFTIGGWVKFESLVANAGIIGKWPGEYVLYYGGVGRFIWIVTGGGSTSVVADNLGTPSTGVWYFVTFYHDASGDEIGIQVNGYNNETAAHATGVTDGGSSFNLSAFVASYFDGLLDEVFVFKQLLTVGERAWLYNDGAGRAYAEIAGGAVPIFAHHYRMTRTA